MRLHKSMKLDACTKGGDKDGACHVMVKALEDGRGVAIATNGYATVVVPHDMAEDDHAGLMTCKTLVQARQGVPKDAKTDGYMQLNCGEDEITLPDAGQSHDRPQPDRELFPTHSDKLPSIRRKGCVAVDVDVWDLACQAEALGCRRVTLRFIEGHEGKGIRVDPIESGYHPGAAGVLHPRKIDAEPDGEDEDETAGAAE